jgi:hypothetical protein
MLNLVQETLVYSLVIVCVLGLSIWWEQTWDPEKKYKWDAREAIVNIGIILIVTAGLVVAKEYGS